MYLSARDLEDQSLAKRIAEEYEIDYNEQVITPAIMTNMKKAVRKLQEYQFREFIESVVEDVLIRNGFEIKRSEKIWH